MTKSHLNNYAKLEVISEKLLAHIDDIFLSLGISFNETKKMYYGQCVVHGGDKHNALNIYKELGNWKCRTHQCHTIFKGSIIGLIRGILSHQKYNWQKSGDKTVSFRDTIKWIEAFLNEDLNKIDIDSKDIEKRVFINSLLPHIKKASINKHNIERNIVKNHIDIPSEYFIGRGFSKEILTKYDVGDCRLEKKEMTDRAVVPVYDDSGKYMVGCTGRSIFEKCNKCSLYHNNNWSICPTYNDYLFTKWKHSRLLDVENVLYNFWEAKEHIKKSGVAIIVESPGNVWRLEENGIHNSVAIFGSMLKTGQRQKLDSSGAMSLVVLLDNDDAGRIGAEEIKKECGRTYRLYFPLIKTNDIAEMSSDEITDDIKPILDKIKFL